MIVTLVKMAAGLLAALLLGMAAMGFALQAEAYHRKQDRLEHRRPEIGPTARPAHEHQSYVATVETGCYSAW